MPFEPTPSNDDVASGQFAELPEILRPHSTGAIFTAALPRLAFEATYGDAAGARAAGRCLDWLLDATPGARPLARRYEDFLASLAAEHEGADLGTAYFAARGHRLGSARTPILEPFELDPAMHHSLAQALAIILSSTDRTSSGEADGGTPAPGLGSTDTSRHDVPTGVPAGTDARDRRVPSDAPASRPLEILLTTHGREPLACGVLFTRDGAERFDAVSMLRRRNGAPARNDVLIGLDALLLRDALVGRAERPTARLVPARDGYEMHVDVEHAIGSVRREWGVAWAFLRRRCASAGENGGARVKFDIPGSSSIQGRMSVPFSSDPSRPVKSRMTFALDGGTLLRMAACERPCRFVAWGSRGNNNVIDTEPMLTWQALQQQSLTMVSGCLDAQALGGRPFRVDLLPGIEWSEGVLARLPKIPALLRTTHTDGVPDGPLAPAGIHHLLGTIAC